MFDYKSIKTIDFSYGRRHFITGIVPGAVLSGIAVKSGIAITALNLLLAGLERTATASEPFGYPGYYIQDKRLLLSGELQVRSKQEKSRIAAGEKIPIEIYKDTMIEYKLIGSLRRYDWEPTNEEFFSTFKGVINNLHTAPKCYEILNSLKENNRQVRHEIIYHPYYTDLTYFMCSKTLHQMHVARTFINSTEDLLTGTAYHEMIAHGNQAVEVTDRGILAGLGRNRIMKQWERELEGFIVKWYAVKEMRSYRSIYIVQSEMKNFIDVFPEWRFFRINEIEKLDINDLISHLLSHYKRKYRNDNWVNTTYLHKLIS